MIDLVAAMAIFAVVTAGIYQVFIPFLKMARSTSERLAVQQDARLAMDRMARDLRETTAALGRFQVYGGGTAVGLVSARPSCTGAFTVDATSGRPLWQAMIYIVRDAPSEEVRAYCDAASTFAAAAPVTTGPHRVLAANVQALTFTQSGTGDSVTIELHERTPRGDADRHIRTEFVPQND
jgi:type II secretory pathway pseudopilin PulG